MPVVNVGIVVGFDVSKEVVEVLAAMTLEVRVSEWTMTWFTLAVDEVLDLLQRGHLRNL